MATSSLARHIGNAINQEAKTKGIWYTPHMAAASLAISERIPLVDLVLEVRDARIPLSSDCELLQNGWFSSRRIILLNKVDLANRTQLKDWKKYFEKLGYVSYAVNSHNKENIVEILSFLQAQVRDLQRMQQSSVTATAMLVGIPNVGKSALANSLHHVGRIGAAEKGKLKHATVSPEPFETKDISSFKIASHPNIYVLDTPGILPSVVTDVTVFSKLALTGSIKDCLVEKTKLAQYFLSILNSSGEYKKWAKISTNHKAECSIGSAVDVRSKRQSAADHTQDTVVHGVRRVLFETISSHANHNGDVTTDSTLIAEQFRGLREAFQIQDETGEDANTKVAAKLLNLFRTGRIGHFTLDPLPRDMSLTSVADTWER